jgi:hypothetical protein
MTYAPAGDRYERMVYRRTGHSGLHLPAISLGLWQNFGDDRPLQAQRDIIRRAFDLGITHLDLANNDGPPYGAAEENLGRILATDLRDELVISTKAGFDMWEGPYGDWGSRKYLTASLDRSWAGWVSTTSTSSTPTASIRTRRSRRRWARWTSPSGRARPSTSVSRRTPRRRPAKPPRSSPSSGHRSCSTSRRTPC